MGVSFALRIAGAVLAGLVFVSEVSYYFSHQDRPGVSPLLIGLSAAVVLAVIAGLIDQRGRK